MPRPDSETLIEAAVDHFALGDGPARILDLGTGPGTLLLAALDQWPKAIGLGVDVSTDALDYALRNAERLGLGERAEFRIGNWADGIAGPFDLILSNPPYIEDGADLPADVAKFEPHCALFAGPDGLAAYQILAPQIARLLAPGGIACLELGAGQAEAVAPLFSSLWPEGGRSTGSWRAFTLPDGNTLIYLSSFLLGFVCLYSYIGARDGASHSNDRVRLPVADPRLLWRLWTILA